MTEIQTILLNMMKDFDTICKSNDIKYFYAGGTALGAIRNEGFLPWDDDVDVLMKRSEYEKLDKVLNEMSLPGREWVTEDNHPDYDFIIARFFDTNTTELFEGRLDFGAPLGLQIEVFIMDPYPEEEALQQEFNKYLWLYGELATDYLMYANPSAPAGMIDEELYYYYKEKVDKLGWDKVKDEVKAKITYPEEGAKLWCGRWSHVPYIFKSEWIEEQKYVNFEGTQIPVMNGVLYEMVENYDSYWNIIPPEKQQRVHPSFKSTSIPYHKHTGKIHELCEKYNYNELLTENKADRLKRIFAREDSERKFAEVKNVYIQQLIKDLEKREWKFELDRLKGINSEYFELFNSYFKKSYYRFNLKLNIRDDLLECILLTLIHLDRYDDAVKFFSVQAKGDVKEKYEELITILGDLKIRKYEDDYAGAIECLEKLEKEDHFLGQVEIERTKMWCLVKSDAIESVEKLEETVAGFYHSKDPDIVKYAGDIYMKLGSEEKAKYCYNYFKDNSRNGMLLYDLQKRGL